MEQVPLAIQVLLIAVVSVAGVTDILYRRIPNWLVVPAAGAGFLVNAILDGTSGLGRAGLGFAVAFALDFVLYLLHARAAGDVKLQAALGAMLGLQNWFVAFIITAIVGGILAVVLMVAMKRVRATLLNSLFILSELVQFRAPHVTRADLDVKSETAFRLPAGAAIALGCFVFLAVNALSAK